MSKDLNRNECLADNDQKHIVVQQETFDSFLTFVSDLKLNNHNDAVALLLQSFNEKYRVRIEDSKRVHEKRTVDSAKVIVPKKFRSITILSPMHISPIPTLQDERHAATSQPLESQTNKVVQRSIELPDHPYNRDGFHATSFLSKKKCSSKYSSDRVLSETRASNEQAYTDPTTSAASSKDIVTMNILMNMDDGDKPMLDTKLEMPLFDELCTESPTVTVECSRGSAIHLPTSTGEFSQLPSDSVNQAVAANVEIAKCEICSKTAGESSCWSCNPATNVNLSSALPCSVAPASIPGTSNRTTKPLFNFVEQSNKPDNARKMSKNFEKLNGDKFYLAKLILFNFNGPFESSQKIMELCGSLFKAKRKAILTCKRLAETVHSYPEIFYMMRQKFRSRSDIRLASESMVEIIAFIPPDYVKEEDLMKFCVSFKEYKHRFDVNRDSFEKSSGYICDSNDTLFQTFISERNRFFGIVDSSGSKCSDEMKKETNPKSDSTQIRIKKRRGTELGWTLAKSVEANCLIIAGIKNHSAAYRGGLKKGDIITSVTNFLDSGKNMNLNLNDDENFDQECTKAIDILITIKPPTLDRADVEMALQQPSQLLPSACYRQLLQNNPEALAKFKKARNAHYQAQHRQRLRNDPEKIAKSKAKNALQQAQYRQRLKNNPAALAALKARNAFHQAKYRQRKSTKNGTKENLANSNS